MDWLAVVVAAILNMVIGFIWYSKHIFGKQWMHLAHVTEHDMNKNKTAILWAAVVSVVIAYFIAMAEMHLGITTVSDGMWLGFYLWLGFVATTQISGVIWRNKSYKLFFINTGCKLLSFLVMGGVIGA